MSQKSPKSILGLANNKITRGVAGMLVICCGYVAGAEGVSLKPYQDLGGVWTICHGETVGITRYSPAQTPESCSVMLKAKLTVVGWQVYYRMKNPDRMSDSQWAALTSFTYNVGIGAFKNSSLLKRLNADDAKACDALLAWTYVPTKLGSADDLKDGKKDGKKNCARNDLIKSCKGLPDRRLKERELCYK